VLRTVLGRFVLTAAGGAPETTHRRGVTFSPRGGATVMLAQRTPASAPSEGGWDPIPVPG
jgi:hypothetical protein